MIHPRAIPIKCDFMFCDDQMVLFPIPPAEEFLPIARERIEHWLVHEKQWIVRDGQHYCCQLCADHVR
jgi:hypothetical protein